MADTSGLASSSSSSLHIKVKTLDSGTHELEVNNETSVVELKNKMSRVLDDAPVERQRFIYKGRGLLDEQTIQGIGITEGDTLHLVVRPADIPPPPPPPQEPQQGFAGVQQPISGMGDIGQFLSGLMNSLTGTGGRAPGRPTGTEYPHLLLSVSRYLNHLATHQPTQAVPLSSHALYYGSEGPVAMLERQHTQLTHVVRQVLEGVPLSQELSQLLMQAAVDPAGRTTQLPPWSEGSAEDELAGEDREQNMNIPPDMRNAIRAYHYRYLPLVMVAVGHLLNRSQTYLEGTAIPQMQQLSEFLQSNPNLSDSDSRRSAAVRIRDVSRLLYAAAALLTETARVTAAASIAAAGNTQPIAANSAAVLNSASTAPRFPRLLPRGSESVSVAFPPMMSFTTEPVQPTTAGSTRATQQPAARAEAASATAGGAPAAGPQVHAAPLPGNAGLVIDIQQTGDQGFPLGELGPLLNSLIHGATGVAGSQAAAGPAGPPVGMDFGGLPVNVGGLLNMMLGQQPPPNTRDVQGAAASAEAQPLPFQSDFAAYITPLVSLIASNVATGVMHRIRSQVQQAQLDTRVISSALVDVLNSNLQNVASILYHNMDRINEGIQQMEHNQAQPENFGDVLRQVGTLVQSLINPNQQQEVASAAAAPAQAAAPTTQPVPPAAAAAITVPAAGGASTIAPAANLAQVRPVPADAAAPVAAPAIATAPSHDASTSTAPAPGLSTGPGTRAAAAPRGLGLGLRPPAPKRQHTVQAGSSTGAAASSSSAPSIAGTRSAPTPQQLTAMLNAMAQSNSRSTGDAAAQPRPAPTDAHIPPASQPAATAAPAGSEMANMMQAVGRLMGGEPGGGQAAGGLGGLMQMANSIASDPQMQPIIQQAMGSLFGGGGGAGGGLGNLLGGLMGGLLPPGAGAASRSREQQDKPVGYQVLTEVLSPEEASQWQTTIEADVAALEGHVIAGAALHSELYQAGVPTKSVSLFSMISGSASNGTGASFQDQMDQD